MKTIISLTRTLNSVLENNKVLSDELLKIKGKRGDDYSTHRDDLKYKISVNNNRIREIEGDIDNTKYIYRKIGWGLLHLLWISVIITGIVLTIKFNYEKGLYILTETHDLVSTFKGDDVLISVDLYNHLFKLGLTGSTCLITGIIGELVTLCCHIVNS